MAEALEAAHRRGLIHRDVKPANVLLAGEGAAEHAYLTDFGIAREVQATGGLTKTGMVVGTLDYIAPERIQDGAGDGRSDVYALGCVLYEALTGSVPFPRDSDVPKMYAHMSEPPPSARDIRPDAPERFAEIALRAMAKDPDERFATADEMAAALTSETHVKAGDRRDRSPRGAHGARGAADRSGGAADGAGRAADRARLTRRARSPTGRSPPRRPRRRVWPSSRAPARSWSRRSRVSLLLSGGDGRDAGATAPAR